MATPIPLLKKGAAPSMMDTATANRLIVAVNNLMTLIVAPNGAGKLVASEGGVVLDLSGLISLVTKIQTAQDAATQTTAPGADGGGGTLEFPFQIQRIDDTTINVRFGTVMDIAPTNVGDDSDLSSITTDGTVFVFIDNTLDADGNITASAIDANDTGRPANTSDHAYKLIGEVELVASVITEINQSLMFSQGFKACDRDPGDPTTTPGTYEFFVD